MIIQGTQLIHESIPIYEFKKILASNEINNFWIQRLDILRILIIGMIRIWVIWLHSNSMINIKFMK